MQSYQIPVSMPWTIFELNGNVLNWLAIMICWLVRKRQDHGITYFSRISHGGRVSGNRKLKRVLSCATTLKNVGGGEGGMIENPGSERCAPHTISRHSPGNRTLTSDR